MKYIIEVPTENGTAHKVIYWRNNQKRIKVFGPEIPRVQVEAWKPDKKEKLDPHYKHMFEYFKEG